MPTSTLDPEVARVLIESAHDFAIIATDPAGRITTWNPGAENILGWSAGEAIGQLAEIFFTPEDRAANAPADEMRRAVADGRAVDERYHARRDGSRFWASGLMMPLDPDERGQARGFVKMMRDRSHEHAADRRWHALSAALPCFVFVTDTDGSNVETNDRFQEYTGRTAAELNGDRWMEVLHENDRARAAEIWGAAVRDGAPYEARYRFRRHNGEYRCFACRGVPERDEEGRIHRWLGTCIDVEQEARAHSALERLNLSLEHQVTRGEADLASAIEDVQAELGRRVAAEEAFRQAQKMEAVGQITGGVAHDFNNFLTVITGSAELLSRPNLPEEKRQRYVSAIAETAQRAAALTRQLLAFARRTPLKPEAFDAGARLEAIVPFLRTTVGSRINLVVERPDEPEIVVADPNQFETAILNLVVNARDAMDGEGLLTLSLDHARELPERRGHAAEPGDYVVVTVADTGTGISPETLGRIFEPFFTTKEVGRGTGLGLSQVFGFAKQSNGDVTVDSEPGQGTQFSLFLPRAKEAQVSEPVIPEPTLRAPGRGCILVVEDNRAVGEFASEILDELGYSTMWAETAQAALDLISERPDRFDAVFSDVVMPGVSGIDMALRLRREHPSIPVVLTSGYSHVLVQEGTHGFELLHKPYSMKALSRVLGRVLDQSRNSTTRAPA